MISKAFAFDIDGVLLRGGKVLPGAKKALDLLNRKCIPWIVLTNGGGIHEKQRVEELSQRIGVPVHINQFLQSHTPFKDFVNNNKRILAIGGKQESVKSIARSYGFKDVVTPIEIVKALPTIHPFPSFTSTLVENKPIINTKTPFDAVFVFHDSYDISVDSQIVVDLLLSEKGQLNTRKPPQEYSNMPSIPLYFSNADLQWAADLSIPRFGQGAFIKTVETLYDSVTEGKSLTHTTIGKPTALTYRYAERLLHEWAKDDISQVYMIGDNQYSDILGANKHGWDSVLVRSGVYKDGDDLFTKPTFIENDVLSAVEKALAN